MLEKINERKHAMPQQLQLCIFCCSALEITYYHGNIVTGFSK